MTKPVLRLVATDGIPLTYPRYVSGRITHLLHEGGMLALGPDSEHALQFTLSVPTNAENDMFMAVAKTVQMMATHRQIPAKCRLVHVAIDVETSLTQRAVETYRVRIDRVIEVGVFPMEPVECTSCGRDHVAELVPLSFVDEDMVLCDADELRPRGARRDGGARGVARRGS